MSARNSFTGCEPAFVSYKRHRRATGMASLSLGGRPRRVNRPTRASLWRAAPTVAVGACPLRWPSRWPSDGQVPPRGRFGGSRKVRSASAWPSGRPSAWPSAVFKNAGLGVASADFSAGPESGPDSGRECGPRPACHDDRRPPVGADLRRLSGRASTTVRAGSGEFTEVTTWVLTNGWCSPFPRQRSRSGSPGSTPTSPWAVASFHRSDSAGASSRRS